MVRDMNWLRISALSAVLTGAALAGCNSQNSSPDSSTGVAAAPVNNTTAAPGNTRSDDNMSGNHRPGNNMPSSHMPNNNGTGNNGTGNNMPGKGMGGMGGSGMGGNR